MPEGTVAAEKGKRMRVSELVVAVEGVLENPSREAAEALMPDLLYYREKLRRLRERGVDIGFSSAVMTVAYLAGREEEFKQFQ